MIYVPGNGNPTANIMLVGEAPGADEERSRQPFVGVAGHELDRMLHDAGIGRHDCFTTNVSRFRPAGNRIDPHFIRREYRTGSRNATALAQGFVRFKGLLVQPHVKEHYEILKQEIEAVNPNVIVALGNTPLQFLCEESGITSWRGSELQTTDVIGDRRYKVIPTYHPAAILRNYDWRWDAVQDLRKVKREAEFPDTTDIQWNFTIRPSFSATVEFLQWLLSQAEQKVLPITCDIETRNYHIACVGIGWSKRDAFCIPIMCAERPEGYWTPEEELTIVKLLRDVLTHPNLPVTNQNYLYDAFYMAVFWGFLSIPAHDTMIAQNVLFPGKEKSLGYIASIHCDNYRYWKEDGREWSKKMDESVLWRYNCMDCCYTYEAGESLVNAINTSRLSDPYKFQMSQFEPTLKAMLHGVRTNDTVRSKMGIELKDGIREREQWLERCFGHKVNPRSPKQLNDLFYVDFGVKPVINRATSKPTVNDAALEVIKVRECLLEPAINRIQEIRTLGIFVSTFLSSYGPRHRIYTGMNIAGTSTFRYSSASNPMGWGTNSQNVPKHRDDAEGFEGDLPNVRQLYLPDDGYVWVKMDLCKADLHVVVWEAGDEELKQQLSEGVNVYKEGSKVVKMPYHQAKMFIHGTDYGGKPRTMARNCGITVHRAELAQRMWFSAHPGISTWQERVKHQLFSTRTVTNRFGYRIFFFGRVDSLVPEALAWVPQSTVARTINNAWQRVYRQFNWNDVRVILQVHDEIDLLVRKELVPTIKPQLLECFNNPVPYPDPLVIPVDAEISDKSWGDVQEWK